MSSRALLAAALLALGGCYEAIEHALPADAGGCSSSNECPCNQQCAFVDGGHFCTPAQPVTCTHDPECSPGLFCLPTHRLGHNCGTLECQQPIDAGH